MSRSSYTLVGLAVDLGIFAPKGVWACAIARSSCCSRTMSCFDELRSDNHSQRGFTRLSRCTCPSDDAVQVEPLHTPDSPVWALDCIR